MTLCKTCGGACFDYGGGEMACINCGRPCNPVVSTVPYEERHVEDIASTIRRERRFIDAQVAAGKRAWA